MTYEKNLGFQEMMQFTQIATPEEQQQMDTVVASEDWKAYKLLINSVLKVNLT